MLSCFRSAYRQQAVQRWVLSRRWMALRQSKQPMTTPSAEQKNHEYEIHGIKRVDPFYWLRNRDVPEDKAKIIDYLNRENDYLQSKTEHLNSLSETLYKEYVSRIKETDDSVPYPHGPYLYYHRNEAGKEYRIYCRKSKQHNGQEEILLDLNTIAADGSHETDFVSLDIYCVSPNHRYLAYSIDRIGNEEHILYFKNLETGATLTHDVIHNVANLEWASDNQTVYYITRNRAWRPYQLWKRTLRLNDSDSEPISDPLLLYTETDEKFDIHLSKSQSDRFVIVTAESRMTTEVRIIDATATANEPEALLTLIEPRSHGVEYFVEHHGEFLYITTNHNDAVNFEVIRTPLTNPSVRDAEIVLRHNPGRYIEHVTPFANHFAVQVREDGLPKLMILDLQSSATAEDSLFAYHYVSFPESVYSSYLRSNFEFDTSTVRLIYSSFITPQTTYDYDMQTQQLTLLKEQPVLGAYDRTLYECKREYAVAADGTQIPISLVYKKGTVLDGNNPLWLTGYGAYGVTYDVSFDSNKISLLDRGIVYAIAQIRGGGDNGRPWYYGGKLLKKRSTFTDFIAAADFLVDSGYTNRNRLAISGTSAGGLLIGAVITMRPDICKVALARVPFVDVINTMLDESIPLTVNEFEEWGNPKDKEYFDYILSYSPYDNIQPNQRYPNLFITSGLNDTRVQYWEPTKFVAKLRAIAHTDNEILLKTNMGAGHAGSAGRYAHLKELASEHAFVIHNITTSE